MRLLLLILLMLLVWLVLVCHTICCCSAAIKARKHRLLWLLLLLLRLLLWQSCWQGARQRHLCSDTTPQSMLHVQLLAAINDMSLYCAMQGPCLNDVLSSERYAGHCTWWQIRQPVEGRSMLCIAAATIYRRIYHVRR